MKLQPAAVTGLLRRPDPKFRLALFYGPDSGLVSERGTQLSLTIAGDLGDPFRVCDIAPAAVAADMARIADEVAAIPFTGGRRLVRIRDADDSVAAAIAALLAAPPPGDGFVVIEAGDLSQRSKLRTACEDSDIAASIPCYVADEQALGDIIAGWLNDRGIRVEPDGVAYLSGQMVGDRRVARNEVDKLAAYAGEQRSLSLEEIRECIGDSAALDPADAVWAAADGDFTALDRALGRLFGEGTAAVALLRTAQRHFQRLHLATSMVAAGKAPDIAVATLKPPVFFKDKGRLTAQVRRWPAGAVAAALRRLVDAEAEVKRSNAPDRTICTRVLFQIASMGRSRR